MPIAIIPNDIEMEHVLLEGCPDNLKDQVRTVLQTDQERYSELQQSCLTAKEKTKMSLFNGNQSLIKGTFFENKPLFKSLGMKFGEWATDIGPADELKNKEESETIQREKQQHFMNFQAMTNQQIVTLKQQQVTLQHPAQSVSILSKLGQLCCGFSKQEISWYILYARIKQFTMIEQKLNGLILNKENEIAGMLSPSN